MGEALTEDFKDISIGVKLSGAIESSSNLSIHLPTEFALQITLVAVTVFASIGVVVTYGPEMIIFFLGLLAIQILGIIHHREITCTINKNTGLLVYQCGGLLGSNFDQKITVHPISDIIAVKTQRYIRRFGDTFRIYLVIGEEKRLELEISRIDLNFKECLDLSVQIQQFLGSDVQLIAQD